MTHTYYQHIYHVVWSTSEREPLIIPEFKQRMFDFLEGAFKTAGCVPIVIGGMPDHIHALVSIPPKYSVSDVIRDVKLSSSKWGNRNLPTNRKFSWQEGYGSFTVSVSQQEAAFNYILNQDDHHKVRTYRDEFLKFLELHEVEHEVKYLWL